MCQETLVSMVHWGNLSYLSDLSNLSDFLSMENINDFLYVTAV